MHIVSSLLLVSLVPQNTLKSKKIWQSISKNYWLLHQPRLFSVISNSYSKNGFRTRKKWNSFIIQMQNARWSMKQYNTKIIQPSLKICQFLLMHHGAFSFEKKKFHLIQGLSWISTVCCTWLVCILRLSRQFLTENKVISKNHYHETF